MTMTNQKTFALKGHICFSDSTDRLMILEHAYVICDGGISAGAFPILPEKYQGIPVFDMGDQLIIPGLTDLHVHAPQYTYRGTSMDLELLDWLNNITFPQEARYADPEYARKAYSIFADDLRHSATTRACIFSTLHVEGTEILMDLLEESGLKTMVGKVNMDRNGSPILQETTSESAASTRKWLSETAGRYQNTQPILTPRFTPSCTDELMEELGNIRKEWKLPVQSHLSENLGEIAWVQQLCPWSRFYGEAYDRFGLFGGKDCPTIMAHCVHSKEEEIALIKERGVFIAHCPQSNMDVMSGIAPIRTYLDQGLHVGLGSDVAGGFSLSIFRAMSDAIQVSKLRWRLMDNSSRHITLEEAFFMATRGGGEFFGKVGSFEKGYEFDALVLSDFNIRSPEALPVRDRLERIVYLSDDRNIVHKYVAGRQLF